MPPGVGDPAHVEKFITRNLGDPVPDPQCAGCYAKAYRRGVMGNRKSDTGIVPEKSVNKTCNNVAELTEGRPVTEGNSQHHDRIRTQCRGNATLRLLAVREAAKGDKHKQFTSLFQHISEALLLQCFHQLKRQSAPGCDGMTWDCYAQNAHANLRELHGRLQRGQYRPRPARQVFIPKEDGTERLLSILCLEDKIVQQAVVTVLNQIYETDFLGFSYGFRPERGQHDALML